MANVEINDLAAKTTPAGTDELEIQETAGGLSKKITRDNLLGSVLVNTTASFLTADKTKLDGIEALADVTDATNVEAAGAVMDGDFGANGAMERTGAGAYTTILNKRDATTGPTANDDTGSGYSVGSRWIDVTNDKEYVCLDNTSAAAVWTETTQAGSTPTEHISIAVSDETTALTTGTAKTTFRMPYAFTLSAVRASVTTAPTGSVLTVDINEGGTTILSTKITIDASEKTSTTASTAPVISDSSLADDAEITIDIDTIGSSVAGAGLKVYLIGTKT